MKIEVKSLCYVALVAAAAGSAAAANFPDADDSHDIASAAAWGGTLPGESENVAFTNWSSKTFYAGNDVKFGNLLNNQRGGYNYTTTFDMTGTPGRRLNFTGFSIVGAGIGHIHHVFKGGYWDFGGGYFNNGGGSSYGDNRTFMISDGAVITNTSYCVLGYTAQGKLRLELSGASRFHVGGEFKFANNKTASGNENWLKVTEGSKMTVGGTMTREGSVNSWAGSLVNQPEGGLFYKDYVIVDGEGSELKMLSTSYNYYGGQGGSATIVSNGGYLLNRGSAVFGARYTRNNLLRVEKNGSAVFEGAFYIGWGQDASDTAITGLRHHRIEVLDGGSLWCKGVFYLSYRAFCSGNTLLVSNGTFRAATFQMSDNQGAGTGYATNILVVLQGENASLSSDNSYAMFNCSHSEYRVEHGARFCPRSSFSWTTDGQHDNVLRVRDGGMLTNVWTNTSIDNPKSDGFAVWNNKIIAEAGGIVTGQHVSVQGSNCVFRVDDSLALLDDNVTAISLQVGRMDTGGWYGGLSTNCALEVAGTTPKLRLGGKLLVENGSRILFELPEAGYAGGEAIIAAGRDVQINPGCEIAFSGAEAMYERLVADGVRANYVLIENPSDRGFVSDDVVAAAQASLGQNLQLRKRVRDGKNQLVLSGGAALGMSLIIR